MTGTFELTSTYVIAAGTAARHTPQETPSGVGSPSGTRTWHPADDGWLVSSFELLKSWPNWEHPHGDEIVHCGSGQCTLLLQTPEGVEAVRLSQGKTVIIPGAPGTPPGSAPGPHSRTSPVGWHDL